MQLPIIRFQHLIVYHQRLDDFDDFRVLFRSRLGNILKTVNERRTQVNRWKTNGNLKTLQPGAYVLKE